MSLEAIRNGYYLNIVKKTVGALYKSEIKGKMFLYFSND